MGREVGSTTVGLLRPARDVVGTGAGRQGAWGPRLGRDRGVPGIRGLAVGRTARIVRMGVGVK